MWLQQVFVACLCVLLGLQQITAVVNNGQKTIELLSSNNVTTSTNTAINNSSSSIGDANIRGSNVSYVIDSVAESSEVQPNRREAPLGLNTNYGVPLPQFGTFQDSYVPALPSNVGLPVPVYGVPDAPTNNIVYPALPPDTPPPVQNLPNIYGPPNNGHDSLLLSLSPPNYGPPPIFAPRPSKPFSNVPVFNIPKPIYGPPPSFASVSKPQYGPPPKTNYIPSKLPKPSYGPPIKLPKPHYAPPKPLYIPPKPVNTYGPPPAYLNTVKDLYNPPKNIYAPPKGVYIPPAPQYGPPEPVPHGPPHPGVPAPPTPPDIKYDGWQPIPGLVSRPPQNYGAPKEHHHGPGDFQVNTDFVPPPSVVTYKAAGDGSFKESTGLSDSYGAPLNTITGSGGVISTSGDDHRNAAAISSFSFGTTGSSGHGGNGLSVIKSIGYEILPPKIKGFAGGSELIADTYSLPPLSSYSSDGLYAAAHSYKTNELYSLDNFANSIASTFDTTLGTSTGFDQNIHSNVGLIPPSGIYGVPPSGKYGTPLLHPPNKFGSPSLNINPPKRPVVFREPVPPGLIESIGNSVVQKDAHGIIESAHSSNYASPTYVPPPIPDFSNTKPVKEEEPSIPSTLYSLPNKNPISFQNYVHGSSTSGINHNFGAVRFNKGNTAAYTSYSAPLKTIDGSYGLSQSNGLAVGFSTPPVTIDNSLAGSFGTPHSFTSHNYVSSGGLSGTYGAPYINNYQNSAGHDCFQKSQPLPPLTFGVPSANTYSASLASLNTNIAGSHHYGIPDLQTANSQKINSNSIANSNSIVEDKKEAEATGKSIAENFGTNSELVKSHSLDLNNIPLQGALGSYTLQIQSANGNGATNNVPHDQVLNDGLLQSILNAIEQPSQNTANILKQPLIHLQQIPPPPSSQVQFDTTRLQQFVPPNQGQVYGSFSDSETQHSLTKNVIVTPPPLQSTSVIVNNSEATVTDKPKKEKEENLSLIDNNEIAIYFNNNGKGSSDSTGGGTIEKVGQENKDGKGNDALKGQQYGSYVSFKTPSSSYSYGDARSVNSTVQGLN